VNAGHKVHTRDTYMLVYQWGLRGFSALVYFV
jgi:hypothetical protein